MNYNTLLRDITRVIVSIGVVGAYIYCVILHDSCADTLAPLAIAVLSAQLGLEGVLKILEGKDNGRYVSKE